VRIRGKEGICEEHREEREYVRSSGKRGNKGRGPARREARGRKCHMKKCPTDY
jgi:hypothetical protein